MVSAACVGTIGYIFQTQFPVLEYFRYEVKPPPRHVALTAGRYAGSDPARLLEWPFKEKQGVTAILEILPKTSRHRRTQEIAELVLEVTLKRGEETPPPSPSIPAMEFIFFRNILKEL